MHHGLLGHWGTTPGLNFIYVHFNRLIKKYDLNVIYVCGPGHGGPGMVANTYLEGTYTEFYSGIQQNEEGMRKLFKQFSFPGGIPSHNAPETPGSIHEGGELGYALVHAYGAVFDNPDLIACCVVGDGEAETGPLAASWHSNKFLNPANDGAVLPILHLNGYKIAGPTVLARIGDQELTQLLRGYGYEPHFVSGHDPEAMHRMMAFALDASLDVIRAIQVMAREDGFSERRHWPMIVLRTPKATRVAGTFLRDVMALNAQDRNFRVMGPDETASNRLDALFEVTGRASTAEILPGDDHVSPSGRVMEVLSEHLCQGWLEGYLLTGRHGLFNCYEAFIHIVDSMFNQHAKWLKMTREIPWRRPIASFNYLLTSHVSRQDHNGLSHQDPGFIDHVANKKAEVVRVYLPPDANTLLSVVDHCLASRN